ncbi:MAG: glutamate-5-semialdehyde dehydrogenase [Bacillota bacterium]|nr:glutamate-5-semialdehyde dehydrogenase [Bacillota bacterium]
MSVIESAKNAYDASLVLSALSGDEKNQVLLSIIDELSEHAQDIFTANEMDIDNAKRSDLTAPLLKRLKFDESKLRGVIEGLRSLIELPDPVGNIISKTELAEGMIMHKVSCPIGVIGVIFESRPDALVQIASLCIKSGNAVILKGGSEAAFTNRVLTQVILNAIRDRDLPDGCITLLETRADVAEMLKCDEYIDLIIPRGSNSFVRYIMENSHIPVMGHADGICHVYVDKDADIDMAVNIIVDSKTQYVAVCNAAETMLVHKDIANAFLPKSAQALKDKGVTLRGDEHTLDIIEAEPATEQDWGTEYLDYILSIKIVENVDEAIKHINHYGSGHTDAIVTSNTETAEIFLNRVDSADVFLNCSTRFADGFRFGFGAEVGISTNKLHARGPVGLEGLTIYKYKVYGNGQIVSDFADGSKKFTHKKI